jgi:hypothetical protein
MATTDEQILRDYFPVLTSEDRALASDMSDALAVAVVVFGPIKPGGFLTPAEKAAAARAQEIRAARGALRTLLARLDERLPEPISRTPGQLVRDIYRKIRGRDYDAALTDLSLLAGLTMSLPAVTSNEIAQALTSSDIQFAVLLEVVDSDEPERLRRKQINTLKGYRGPKVDSDQRARLIELRGLLAGGAERDFRVGLLRGECNVGLARQNAAGGSASVDQLFRDAILAYHRLLPASQAQVLTPRQALAAVREGQAHAGRADALYRRSFRFTADERGQIAEAYCGAIQAVSRNGVAGPAAEQVKMYASQQIAKLVAGQNFLGYRDSYVPDRSPATLATLAKARIDAAVRASERFERFKTNVDTLLEELAELTEKEKEREVGLEIARLTTANAAERAGDAQRAIDHLKDKSDDLLLGLGAGLAQAVFATVSVGARGTTLGGQASGPGVISSVVQYLGAREDLANQQQAAESAKRIAGRDSEVAQLEEQLAQARLDFVKAAIAAKTDGSFNVDRFVAVANTYEDMARRHLERACELLYLYERAVAFRRLKSLTIVESAAADGDVLLAPDQLSEIWLKLNEESKADGRGQNSFPLPPWSLRTRYPLEFARLLQTGSMDFIISVYELERLLHGTFNVRIRRVGVEVTGLVSTEGFVGKLIHRGVTLIRDRAGTLQPPATRLVPTANELDAALDAQESGRTDRVVVQGLVPMLLDEDTLTISSEPDVPLPDEDGFDLLPIENYGLTGAWRLELPDVDLRGVDDVRLKFVVSLPESDPAVDRHILDLIDTYESELAADRALDAVLGISLRRRFPDAFDALATGTAAFDLRDVDFADDVSDLRVKAVLAQAVDVDGRGVAGVGLDVEHPPALAVSRTTGPDGFTEDLSAELPDLPEPQRVPPVGGWRVRLLDRGQFAQLEDLIVFVVYTSRRDDR